jgi:protein-tyrosine phosphatase
MIKIMFVCHGNICRSPMAEFVLKDMVKKAGRENEFVIASSATSTEEIWGGVGNPVYPPARDELKKHGISCEGKRAVQVKKSDYENYDYLICMDENNMRNIRRIIGSDPEGKIVKLLSFTSENRNVADPWYSGDFETCYSDIYNGCKALLETLGK